jgi:hypothetical protein
VIERLREAPKVQSKLSSLPATPFIPVGLCRPSTSGGWGYMAVPRQREQSAEAPQACTMEVHMLVEDGAGRRTGRDHRGFANDALVAAVESLTHHHNPAQFLHAAGEFSDVDRAG